MGADYHGVCERQEWKDQVGRGWEMGQREEMRGDTARCEDYFRSI